MGVEMTKTGRLYQDIGIQLRERIAAGEYRIGDRLPPEREIAGQLGVSRAVIREALIMLELEGLIEVRKGSGVYIVNLPDASSHFAASANETVDAGPFEMLQARQVLESHIAQFAATQVTKGDIVKLRQALELERQQLAGGELDDSGDEMFHFAIAEATQNSVLAETAKDLWNRRHNSPMWNQLHSRITDLEYRHQWLKDHEQILSAFMKRDPEAAYKAMWQHLENVKQTLLELSDVDDPNFDGYLFDSPMLLK